MGAEINDCMLNFHKLGREDLPALCSYFKGQTTHIADYSVGFQFMWHKHLSREYAVWGGCLLLRELFAGKYYFYYPLSLAGREEEEHAAVGEIEKFCRDEDIRLHYTDVPRAAFSYLAARYSDFSATDTRRWRDYLYEAEGFRTFAGGKYAGQRNHVNKFKKCNTGWEFRECGEDDLPALLAFLEKYGASQREKHEFLADEELEEVYELLPHVWELGLFCGALFVRGEPIGFSVGEQCGDMVVIHIEKALRSFEGAYPMLAQQFALAFAGDAKYLNRMDDAGDLGLRKSKLQYLPCELVDKYNVIPARAIDAVSRLPEIGTERLSLRPVAKADESEYARLASDVERNRYWGYDWREARRGKRPPAAGWFRRCTEEDFHRRMEMPLGIYRGEKLVGEVVLHRFGYRAEAEIGVRLLPEEEGKGYAREAVRAYTDHAISKYGIERMEAKCFRENTRSRAMLEGAGMRLVSSDDAFFYFLRTPEM